MITRTITYEDRFDATCTAATEAVDASRVRCSLSLFGKGFDLGFSFCPIKVKEFSVFYYRGGVCIHGFSSTRLTVILGNRASFLLLFNP